MFGSLKVYAIAGAVVALAGALTWSHVAAYRSGAAKERAAMLERSVENLRERNATDERVENMDDGELCRAIGGVFTNGKCE